MYEITGTYTVIYKHPSDSLKTNRIYNFTGQCENFVTVGVCAFFNEEFNEMLLVRYEDIIQMKLTKIKQPKGDK